MMSRCHTMLEQCRRFAVMLVSMHFYPLSEQPFVCSCLLVLLGATLVSLQSQRKPPSDSIKDIASGELQLGARLVSGLPQGSDNYVLSPLNLEIALHTIAVAVGDQNCRGELKKLVGETWTPSRIQKIREYINEYADAISNNNFSLSFLNAMFYRTGLSIRPQFKSHVEYLFGTEFAGVNFRNKVATGKIINDKVSAATKGMIDKAIDSDSISDDAQVMSINALYYKALWKEPFEKRYMGTFYLPNGSTKRISMMSAETNVSYLDSRDLKLQLIAKPYGYKNFKLIVMLPNSKSSIEEMENLILTRSADVIKAVLQDAWQREMSVTLPIIDMEETIDVGDIMRNKNINCIFNGGLNGITGRPLSISKMTHKVKFLTDENGSEGAAVTILEVVPLMATTTFVANRPFMYFVADMDTGFIVFMGKLTNPK